MGDIEDDHLKLSNDHAGKSISVRPSTQSRDFFGLTATPAVHCDQLHRRNLCTSLLMVPRFRESGPRHKWSAYIPLLISCIWWSWVGYILSSTDNQYHLLHSISFNRLECLRVFFNLSPTISFKTRSYLDVIMEDFRVIFHYLTIDRPKNLVAMKQPACKFRRPVTAV